MGEAKRKNQRECPALGRTISAAECGNGRNSTIPCPTDCPHNPFSLGNYLSQFGPLEEKVIHKVMRLLGRDLTPAESREIARSDKTFDTHALVVWHAYGRGLLDRWIAAGDLKSWKNDERFMAGCFATMRISLTEILRVEVEVSVIVRDLLQPALGEIRLIDTGFVRQARRFQNHLCWIYRVPAGWRSSGAAIEFMEMGDREPEEALAILLDHLGAPDDERQKWLLEHMPLLNEAITEIAMARQRESMNASDMREVTRDFSASAASLRALAVRLGTPPQISPGDAPGRRPA
jgi:hypothetical protein